MPTDLESHKFVASTNGNDGDRNDDNNYSQRDPQSDNEPDPPSSEEAKTDSD